ncbi:MAG: dihydroneopterin triphosphate diphosphatase [Gammaproteobacteria bacterium]
MPDAAFKRPESVLVLVASHVGEVLLIERRFPASFWQSVTGSLEWGESALDAARRELLEETGIAVEAIEDLQIGARFYIRSEWRKRFAPGVQENREHWFRLWLDASVPVRLSREHVCVQWLPVREAVKRVASWSNRVALQRYILQPLCQE